MLSYVCLPKMLLCVFSSLWTKNGNKPFGNKHSNECLLISKQFVNSVTDDFAGG